MVLYDDIMRIVSETSLFTPDGVIIAWCFLSFLCGVILYPVSRFCGEFLLRCVRRIRSRRSDH